MGKLAPSYRQELLPLRNAAHRSHAAERLGRIADVRGQKASALIREAIDAFLRRAREDKR